ncbi:ATP-binding cassette domain-containing protein [Lactococcus lactis]
MNIINGNVKASSGKIEYGKMKPTSNNTGYIMQNMTLPPDALVSEVLALFSNDEQSKEYGLKLVKEFKMESYLKQRFSNLSGGQKQKLFWYLHYKIVLNISFWMKLQRVLTVRAEESFLNFYLQI